MILLLAERPIDHEFIHPPLFCSQSEDYCEKQNKPANFNTISATINNTTHHQQYIPQGVHTYPFVKSLSYVYQLHQVPSGPVYTRKTLPGTSFPDLQILFDLNIKTRC